MPQENLFRGEVFTANNVSLDRCKILAPGTGQSCARICANTPGSQQERTSEVA